MPETRRANINFCTNTFPYSDQHFYTQQVCVRTFGETLCVAVDLQGVHGADLQVDVIVQELLHHRLERQQELLLLIQLLFTGG